jgi:hypothetical protein
MRTKEGLLSRFKSRAAALLERTYNRTQKGKHLPPRE